MNRTKTLAPLLLTLLLVAPLARAEEPNWKFGAEVDLLPYLSDGYSISAIAGKGRLRGRLVRSELTIPDLLTDDDFRDNDLEVVALILDVFLHREQTGWWFGAGIEQWEGEVTEKDSGTTQPYETTVVTVGAGYVWRIGRHFTINPWAGVHIPVGGDRFIHFPSHEFSIDATPEASLKLGVSF